MALSPTDAARMAEIDLRREEMFREQQQASQAIADRSMAWGVAGTMINLTTHGIGKKGVAAFDFMSQWVKVFKNDEQAAFLSDPSLHNPQINTISFENNVGSYDAQGAFASLNTLDEIEGELNTEGEF